MATNFFVDFETVVSGGDGSFNSPFDWDGWIYHMRYGEGEGGLLEITGINYYVFGGIKELYEGSPTYDIYINMSSKGVYDTSYEINIMNYDSTPWQIIYGDGEDNSLELNFKLGMDVVGKYPPKQLNFYGGIIKGTNDHCHLNFYSDNTSLSTSMKFNNMYLHQSETIET